MTGPIPTAATASDTTLRFPARALGILSAAVLVTVTAESLPAGLMPEMARELRVDPLQIGLLISVWAVTVIVSSIPLARATMRFDRRLVVGVSLAVFALANIATALAPTYAFALGTRVAAALAHGLFWAVVMVYASALLSPSHLGRGLAIVTSGGTLATVVGLPAATLLAQAWGWRAAFVVLGSVALLLGLVVVRAMPRRVPAVAPASEHPGGILRDPSLPALAAFGGAAILMATAQFASFTYIRPYFEVSASIGAEWAAPLIFVYGAAGLVGVVVAGFLADRFPRSSLIVALVAFAAAFGVLTFAASSPAAVIAGLVVWGLAFGAIFPLLQTTLLRVATERTKILASAGISMLFNIGIAAGPLLGGMLGAETQPTLNTAASAIATLAAAALGAHGVVLAIRRGR